MADFGHFSKRARMDGDGDESDDYDDNRAGSSQPQPPVIGMPRPSLSLNPPESTLHFGGEGQEHEHQAQEQKPEQYLQYGNNFEGLAREARIEQQREVDALMELLKDMDQFSPAIPDVVTQYYLNRSGFDCSDPKILRLVALAAQKFVTDIACDTATFARIRTEKRGNRDKKNVMTMEDLALALRQYGLNVKKPPHVV